MPCLDSKANEKPMTCNLFAVTELDWVVWLECCCNFLHIHCTSNSSVYLILLRNKQRTRFCITRPVLDVNRRFKHAAPQKYGYFSTETISSITSCQLISQLRAQLSDHTTVRMTDWVPQDLSFMVSLFNSWVGFFCSFARCISHKSLENNWNYKFKDVYIYTSPQLLNKSDKYLERRLQARYKPVSGLKPPFSVFILYVKK